MISNYDIDESTTAKVIYQDAAEMNPTEQNIEYGRYTFSGTEYKDKMCLYQTSNDRSDSSGNMCVTDMPFISV